MACRIKRLGSVDEARMVECVKSISSIHSELDLDLTDFSQKTPATIINVLRAIPKTVKYLNLHYVETISRIYASLSLIVIIFYLFQGGALWGIQAFVSYCLNDMLYSLWKGPKLSKMIYGHHIVRLIFIKSLWCNQKPFKTLKLYRFKLIDKLWIPTIQ